MAISAPLCASKRFNSLCPPGPALSRQRQRVPNLLCQSFAACRHQYSGGFSRCSLRCLPCRCCLRATPRRSTTTGVPSIQIQRDVLSKLQCSLNATARSLCLPCSGQDFYFRAFAGRVAPKTCVGYNFMAHRLVTMAGSSPAGLAALWAAMEFGHS